MKKRSYLREKVASFFKYYFGTISYQPPGFISPLGRGIKKSVHFSKSQLNTFKTARPGLYAGVRIALPAIFLLALGLGIWQSTRPEPRKLAWTMDTPGLTPLDRDARPSALYIRFSASAARLEEVQKVIDKSVKIDPKIEGEWKWAKDDLMQFTPVTDWLPGREYRVSLSKDLFPSHIRLEKYQDSFKTPQFRLRIVSCEFYIDPVKEDIKQVAATIRFSHPVDSASFAKKITLGPHRLDKEITAFQDRDYGLTITYDEFFGKAYILSEPLPMPEDNVTMQLTVAEGVRSIPEGGLANKAEARVIIPGITSFIRINSVEQTLVRNQDYRLEQVLVISSKGKARSQSLLENMEVWILPQDRPATPGTERMENYSWSDPAMVGPGVLALSTELEPMPIESEHEYEEINSYKITAEPGKYLYVYIKKGAPFYGKYSLSKDYHRILRIKEYPRQLEIMHEGIILSSTGEKKVSLMAQGVEYVQFRIGRVQPDQLNHLVSQTNGNLTDVRFHSHRFSEENIVENYYEIQALHIGEPGEPVYFSYDFSRYLQPQADGRLRHGIFFFEVKEWDPVHNRVYGPEAKRLIMVSDLGLLAKDGANDAHDLFVQSIATGAPVANARIQVLGKNGIPVLSSVTDVNGHAALPSLKSFSNEKAPTVYLVSTGDDLSFMPVEASGRWLNFTKFDVGGVHGATDPAKINAYLFSDRGIYRPGDLFHIGMIVKSGDWAINLAGMPLEAAIIDARGLEIYKKMFKLSADGVEELEYSTENTSPTGTYQVNLYTIVKDRRSNHIGSTTIKVEEFLPDRLSISSIFPGLDDKAWMSPDGLTAVVALRNLFGTPARGNRVAGQMRLAPGRLRFRPYRDFRFSDPFTVGKSYSETLAAQTTDEGGNATFDFNLGRFEAATYTLTFTADGFEKEGGRSVGTASSVLLSPLPYLIGTKANGDLSYIYRSASRSINVIAVDRELKQVAVADITFELNEIRYVSVLTKLPNGTYAYKSVPKTIPVSTSGRNIPSAGLDVALKTDTPGEYELCIKNSDGVQFSRINYSVVGAANLTRSLDRTAELDIRLNKTDYEPGEEIEVYVKAPYSGAGLITIERDKIYASQWFKSQDNSFIKKIKLPTGLEGNGYVNVSFVRAADSKEIYMSPLSYGVAPFSVSKKNRITEISIDIPAQARSGEPFPIKYKSDKPGKIVVLAVDEGILQVANYQTPDPLGHFFRKRALEVKTSQLLDLILPEFSLFRSSAAMGGGTGFEEIAKNLNPFKRKQDKPVVFWSGILDSDRTERTCSYTVPDYFNGTLRVMAVVVSPQAIGTFEERAIVKNPFVISPNVPMFAAPGDSFQVTVTVTNSIAGSGKRLPVDFTVTGTPHLQVLHNKQQLFIDENADTTVQFYVKANNLPGAASLHFTASGGVETTRLASHLSVRPAQPYQTRVTSGVIKKGSVDVETPRKIYKDFRVLTSSVSFLPLGLSKGLVTYLDRFPYGCTEQVVSQAFPYLYLRDVNGFGIPEGRAREKSDYALKVLQARQNGEGKFGFWAANSFTSDFVTVYGMHFITECRKAGYYVSDVLYDKGVAALKEIAGQKGTGMNDWRVQAYAVYLLTRNEMVTTNYIASLRKTMDQKAKDWQDDLAGGYLAASYGMMQQDGEANTILDRAIKSQLKAENPWHFCNGFIQNAQVLYLLSEHAPEKLKQVSDRMISGLVAYLQRGAYNTITSSYTVMALSAYAKAAGEPVEGKLAIAQILQDKSREVLQLPGGQFPTVDYSERAAKIAIENEENLNLYYQVVQGGFDTTLPEERVSQGIELFREFTQYGKPVTRVSLGDEVEVHLKFRSLDGGRLENVALVDLLPAGLEAEPTSVRGQTRGSWQPDYTDIREDRLVIFGTVTPEVKEFVYTVRAINKGTFTVPPIYGESMYDRAVYAFSPQEALVVE